MKKNAENAARTSKAAAGSNPPPEQQQGASEARNRAFLGILGELDPALINAGEREARRHGKLFQDLIGDYLSNFLFDKYDRAERLSCDFFSNFCYNWVTQTKEKHRTAVDELVAIRAEDDNAAGHRDKLANDIGLLVAEIAVIHMLEFFAPGEVKAFMRDVSSAYDGAFTEKLDIAQLVYDTVPIESSVLEI